MRWTWLTVLSLALAIACPAQAQLSANPAILAFDAGQTNRKDIKVANTGSRPQYLEVSAARITNTGEHPEVYFQSTNPEEVGLIVAPRRIVLQPGEERVIRVILLETEIAEDKAWRVRIEPTIGEVESDQTVAVALLGYNALVFARPENPFSELVGTRDGKTLTVTNTGNSNVVLHSGEQCSTPDAPCASVTGKRLWPGAEWTTELPEDGPVSFALRDTEDDRRIEF